MSNEGLTNVPVTARSRSVLRFLKISIHAAHAVWIVALVVSVAKNGTISNYALFMPPLILASCLEMCHWALVGRKTVDIKGTYSHASAIESANRECLLFTQYIPPIFPPFKLIERYTEKITKNPEKKTQSQVLARFWLKSEMVLPMLVINWLLVTALYEGHPPSLYGLVRFHSLICLVWIVGLGGSSKSISVLIYSSLVRIFKGF